MAFRIFSECKPIRVNLNAISHGMRLRVIRNAISHSLGVYIANQPSLKCHFPWTKFDHVNHCSSAYRFAWIGVHPNAIVQPVNIDLLFSWRLGYVMQIRGFERPFSMWTNAYQNAI